jgi:hypothetical protein
VQRLENFRGLFIFLLIATFSCKKEDAIQSKSLFTSISSSTSNIHFANTLTDSENFNIIEYLYYYNGGGVAIGDINNDGLPDIYFSGNQVENKLYLNKGNFEFEDITEKSGAGGVGNWKTGVNMVDINADGFLDIFICGVGNYKQFDGQNQLLINNGDLTFTDKTKEFGLSFKGFSTQAAFLDFDLDGDLDMYLLNHSVHTQRSYGKISLRYETDSLAGDKLYKNLFAETQKFQFEEVTKQAGILSSQIGYGLGIGISDVNRDGYPDIYVSNDFIENDYLYVNNKNGTFSQQLEKSLSHTSRFSMGNDIADINNDQWPDIFTSDMLPRDESVIKTSAGEDSYEVYSFKLKYGYHKQVSRNTLQINRGILDSNLPVFTDVAAAAGVEATDWSWSPLLVDFDGDGWKDIFVSNGIVKRPNDLDYINFISSDSVQKLEEVLPWLNEMPDGKVSNYIFKNNHDLSFEDKTNEWGLSIPSISNGASYSDLDNDGDPDLVVNRINEEPLIYRNNSSRDNFVEVVVHGDSLSANSKAIGAKVIVTSKGLTQSQEIFPTRGWCSSTDYPCIFGIGDNKNDTVSVQVVWPNGQTKTVRSASRKIEFYYSAQLPLNVHGKTNNTKTLFRQVIAPHFKHVEDEFNAFNQEYLIPHALTTEGPAMATGDINRDGLDDVYFGGAKGQSGAIFTQSKNGQFTKLQIPDFEKDKFSEDVAAEFFDADNDSDLDLVVVAGGQEEYKSSSVLRPRLYINNGKGSFRKSLKSIPEIFLHASCVKPADYDGDGDIDLFIAASVMPMLYGMSPQSYLLDNDGTGNFINKGNWLGKSVFDNPTRVRPGMIKDAVWTDINNDKKLDLILAGEWMPITILLQQNDHTFLNSTNDYQLTKTRGWWNSIVAKDFDNDGDIDLVAGNFGLNSRLKASTEKPLQMFLGDFDSNGGSDHILVYYNGDKSYPFTSRDQLVKQLPGMKKKFLRYRDYRDVKLEDIVTPEQKGNSALMMVDDFSSAYLENKNHTFVIKKLPFEAQLFPIFDMIADDVDEDGFTDLLIGGNLEASQPEIGPYDAGLGLFLKGNGNGVFTAIPPGGSGFVARGETREIGILKGSDKKKIYVVGRNNDSVLAFERER